MNVTQDILRFLASAAASAVLVYLITPLFVVLAFRLGIIDAPGGRKIHKKITPLLGGLSIYTGYLVGVLSNFHHLAHFLPLMSALTIIFAIGLIDDIHGLSAQTRLAFQFIASVIVIASGGRIDFLPAVWWGEILEMIVTLLWLIGVTNAFNYLDGMDGLATGSAIINLFFFAVILFITGQRSTALLTAVAIGPCVGFLPHNFRKAKIFLGDAGSTFLGFFIASIGVIGYWAADNIAKITIPILILGVPIFDMIFTTIMRVRDGRVKTVVQWLKYSGRDHFHHYLVDLGLRPTGAVLFIYLITTSLGISALNLSNDNAIEAVLTLFQASIIFIMIAMVIVVGRRHEHGWGE
ncbi:MAG: undecaprenyl/decaprenyl-phosphate alpha-N-acetylglucosaminyl 1-phosphate transferase [Candidatus Omnitrophica bacterium]|nr:undecaprenyl/decaprenyl-phosphate alpha-N-acetylglucosaminyl 1-phosphate transferase [Candidatus Omnitrophota bacterium]